MSNNYYKGISVVRMTMSANYEKFDLGHDYLYIYMIWLIPWYFNAVSSQSLKMSPPGYYKLVTH